MTRYNKVHVKLSDSHLNELNSGAKDQTGVTLRVNIKLSDGNIPHKLLITTRHNIPHKLLITTRQRT